MELCAVVSRVAINRAVMSAVANSNIANDAYLGRYTDLVTQTARVRNFLVVALDEKTGAYLSRKGVSYYVRRFKTRTGADSSTTDNHATSALKFVILTELLSIGVSVLLTDVDVPVFSDPFLMLYRDSDIENMSDGCGRAGFEGTRKHSHAARKHTLKRTLKRTCSSTRHAAPLTHAFPYVAPSRLTAHPVRWQGTTSQSMALCMPSKCQVRVRDAAAMAR